MSEGGSDEAVHTSLFRMVPTRDAFSDNNDGVDSKVGDGRDKAGHEEKEAGLRFLRSSSYGGGSTDLPDGQIRHGLCFSLVQP